MTALKLAAEVHEFYGLSVNPETVRRVIRSNGYHGRMTWKKFSRKYKEQKTQIFIREMYERKKKFNIGIMLYLLMKTNSISLVRMVG